MDDQKPSRRIAALNEASRKKKHDASIKTQQAIDSLIQNKQRITIRSVAKEAGVSVSYIYKYPELAYKIQSLRDSQKYDSIDRKKLKENIINNATNSSNEKDKLIAENDYLKTYMNTVENKKKSVSELQKENAELQIENKKLKRELEFARQQLAETRNFILSKAHNDTEDTMELKTRERVVKEIT